MAQLLSHSLFLTVLVSSAAAASLSTSVFPQSVCSSNGNEAGFVGIGKLTLASGKVEAHCGCSTDNLPSFEPCFSFPSSETVCNSVLDLESGDFSASCGAVLCSGGACPKTVVNTVIVDGVDCASHQSELGYWTMANGEAKCACSTGSGLSGDFTSCPSTADGYATCVSRDEDFLGHATRAIHLDVVQCGTVCDEGFALTAAGTCVAAESDVELDVDYFHIQKRYGYGPSMTHPGPSAHHHHPSSTPTSTPVTETPPPCHPKSDHHGASQHHHSSTDTEHHGHHAHAHHSQHCTVEPETTTHPHTEPTTTHHHHHPSPSHHHHHPSKAAPGPSQMAKTQKAFREFDLSNVLVGSCTASERTCPSGVGSDEICVKLDDARQCGGCNFEGTAQNCLAQVGVASAKCLKSGCVVDVCMPGYVQTSDDTCELKK